MKILAIPQINNIHIKIMDYYIDGNIVSHLSIDMILGKSILYEIMSTGLIEVGFLLDSKI